MLRHQSPLSSANWRLHISAAIFSGLSIVGYTYSFPLRISLTQSTNNASEIQTIPKNSTLAFSGRFTSLVYATFERSNKI